MNVPNAFTKGFVTAYHPGTNTYHVGILTTDGRCRVDFHGDLSELKLYKTKWKDDQNPWKGGVLDGEYTETVRMDWT